MLSIYTLQSAQQASTYYQQGDYSTLLGANERSEWFGTGAEHLDLKGPVKPAIFEKLLEGTLPNGQKMTGKSFSTQGPVPLRASARDGRSQQMNQSSQGQHHRPGYDLTFSAPKTVSILALVLGDPKILQAHRDALRLTLSDMEKKYASTRVKEKGVVRLEKTKNWTVACFEHVDSRSGDPALHTHAVVLNMTLTHKKAWRTIFGDALYQNKMLDGMRYRAYLAPILLKMGLELDFKQNGLFEIKGLEDLIEPFSKRSQAIRADLQQSGQSGGKAASQANLRTRKSKKKHYPAARQARWIREVALHGFDVNRLEDLIKAGEGRGPILLPDPAITASMALTGALEHLSEFMPSFSIPKLIQTAVQISLRPHNEADFLNLIEAKIKDQTLWYGVKDGIPEQCVTPERIQLEQSVLAQSQKVRPVIPLVSEWLRKTTAQRVCCGIDPKSLVELLGSQNSQILLKAKSAQGLEKLVMGYCKIAQWQHAYPRILCQRSQDVAALQSQNPNQPIHSIEGFLSSCKHRAAAQKSIHPFLKWGQSQSLAVGRDIWIVQGNLGLSQVQRLQEAAEIFGARLIFATSHATATHTFLEQKMPIIEVECKDKGSLETLVKALNDCASEGRMTEMADPTDRLNKAIQQCCTPETLVPLVVLNAFEQRQGNAGIRCELLKQGRIAGPALETTILKPVPLSQLQKSQVHQYQLGDLLCFEKVKPTDLPTYWRVEATCLESGLLELSSAGNALWDFSVGDHQQSFSVFRAESRVLQTGDQIRWTRSHKCFKKQGAYGGAFKNSTQNTDRIKDKTAQVSSVDVERQTATVILKNGLEICLDLKTNADQHWDYGYALRLHQASYHAESVLLLDHQKLDEKAIAHLHQRTQKASPFRSQIVCVAGADLINRILQDPKPLGFVQTPYDRANLAPDQILNTHLLFPGLEKAYLKAKGSLKMTLPSKKDLPIDLDLRLSSQALDRACMGAFEREAVVSRETLFGGAAVLMGQGLSFQSLDRAFDRALKEGWLHRVGQNPEGEDLLSARHILLIEKRCQRGIVEAQDQVKPLFAKGSLTLEAIQSEGILTDGQFAAVELMLSTPHRLVAVQGIAGSGKTTALKCIREQTEKIGVKALVLANLTAAKEKAQDSSGGMQAMTTAQFLSQSRRALCANFRKARLEYGRLLLILDESSVTSTDQFFELMQIVTELGSRLVVIGDFKQQGSIRWGMFFHELLAYGLKTVVMRENVRFKNIDTFKISQKTYAGDMQGALKMLGDRLFDIPVKEEALEFMVQHCKASALSGPRIWPIVPSNGDRKIVNAGIRAHLIQEGFVESFGLKTEILVRIDRREVDKYFVDAYQIGEILLFNRSPHRAIQAGDYASIDRIEGGRLVLQKEDGSYCYWQPKDLKDPRDVEVYQPEVREFSRGDRILFSRNQEKEGIINGEFASILGVEGTKLRLELKDRCIVIDVPLRSAQHLDYGYALTTTKIQGQEGGAIGYGETPKPYERATRDLRVHDEIILLREHTGDPVSKWVKVQEIVERTETQGFDHCRSEIQLKLVDAQKKVITFSALPDLKWSYNPPFEQRSPYEIPKSSTQQAFLVQSTRGDNFVLVTTHAQDFRKCLEAQAFQKRSAASFQDPHWEALHKKVQNCVLHIESKPQKQAALKAELEAITAIHTRHQAWMVDRQTPEIDKTIWLNCESQITKILEAKNIKPIPENQAELSRNSLSVEDVSKILAAMREGLKQSRALHGAATLLSRSQERNSNACALGPVQNAKAIESSTRSENTPVAAKKPEIDRDR